MPVAITSIAPGRGRPADVVTINGDGFSATLGQNVVTVDGVLAGVNAATATALTVVVPLGLSVDQHVEVSVTNLDDATSALWNWWSKDTVANTAAAVLRTKVPFIDEILRGLARDVKNMNTAEARFFERLATKIELIPDLLTGKGDFFSKAAAPLGIRRAPAGTAGQPFVSSAAGGAFQDRHCWLLQWGKAITGTDLTLPMNAGGTDVSGANLQTYNVAPITGQLALVSMRESVSASSRVNRIEILVNDVVVLDLQNGDPDFPGPGIRSDSLTFYPGIPVTQGDRVQARISRNNVTSIVNVLCYGLVV